MDEAERTYKCIIVTFLIIYIITTYIVNIFVVVTVLKLSPVISLYILNFSRGGYSSH